MKFSMYLMSWTKICITYTAADFDSLTNSYYFSSIYIWNMYELETLSTVLNK